MPAIDAVVAAGGRGQRLGEGRPKALTVMDGVPMIVHTVRALIGAGVRRIVAYVDDPHWVEAARRCTSSFGEVSFIQDRGYASTIDLARAACGCVSDRFVFAYGHAPRPVAHFSRLLTVRARVGVTLVSSSSRRRLISWGAGYLEPPCIVNGADLLATTGDWRAFMEAFQDRISPIAIDAPGEFNSREEREVYRRYMSSDVFAR